MAKSKSTAKNKAAADAPEERDEAATPDAPIPDPQPEPELAKAEESPPSADASIKLPEGLDDYQGQAYDVEVTEAIVNAQGALLTALGMASNAITDAWSMEAAKTISSDPNFTGRQLHRDLHLFSRRFTPGSDIEGSWADADETLQHKYNEAVVAAKAALAPQGE